jgi:hypothetical protein
MKSARSEEQAYFVMLQRAEAFRQGNLRFEILIDEC